MLSFRTCPVSTRCLRTRWKKWFPVTYLVKEKPDAILNIIDGTNIERNLYLTTQLIELGIPVVMAVNMIDLVRKNGDKIDLKKLSAELGCQAVEISALKGEGTEAAAKAAVAAAKATKAAELPHVFTGSVEHAIAHIEESIQGKVDDRFLRWYAVKLFERDEKVMDELKLDKSLTDHIDAAHQGLRERRWTMTLRASSPTSAMHTSTPSWAKLLRKRPAWST